MSHPQCVNEAPRYVINLAAALETATSHLFHFQRSFELIAINERTRAVIRALADPANQDAGAIWRQMRLWSTSTAGHQDEVRRLVGEIVICERDATESPAWTRKRRLEADRHVLQSARKFAAAIEAHPKLALLPSGYIWRSSEIDQSLGSIYETMLESESIFRRIGFSDAEIDASLSGLPSLDEARTVAAFDTPTMAQLAHKLIGYIESLPVDRYSPRPRVKTATTVQFQRSLAQFLHVRHPLARPGEVATVVHAAALCAFRFDRDLVDDLSLEGTLELVKAATKAKPTHPKGAN